MMGITHGVMGPALLHAFVTPFFGLRRIWQNHMIHVLIGRHLAKLLDDIEESWKEKKPGFVIVRRACQSTMLGEKP